MHVIAQHCSNFVEFDPTFLPSLTLLGCEHLQTDHCFAASSAYFRTVSTSHNEEHFTATLFKNYLKDNVNCWKWAKRQKRPNKLQTSLPYFGVKLSCVCLMFAYRKKLPIVTLRWPTAYSYHRVTYSEPKVTYSDPTHLPLPQPTSLDLHLAIS